MAEAIGEDCELIELGSGSGLKTRLLLEHLRAPRAYIPIDISREHLSGRPRTWRAASPASSHPGLRRLHRAVLAARDRRPERAAGRLLPGLDDRQLPPRAAVRLLARSPGWSAPAAACLIGFDLDKDESIVWPAYNDRRGIDRRVQPEPAGADQSRARRRLRPRRLRHRADLSSAHRNGSRCTWSAGRTRSCGSAGRTFDFREGETIHTEDSYKYSSSTSPG